jgi:hypothetical protein
VECTKGCDIIDLHLRGETVDELVHVREQIL